MSDTLIVLNKNEALNMRLHIEEMMNQSVSRSYNDSYSRCVFCHQRDNFRGKIIHKDDCAGKSVYTKIVLSSKPDISATSIAALLSQDKINPVDGVGSIKWLLNKTNHGLDSLEVLRMINRLKKKMGIPF